MSKSQIKNWIRQPDLVLSESLETLYSLDPEQLDQYQTGALQTRFEALRNKIPALKRLADGQGITNPDSLDTAAQLLFQHTIYKSYPLAMIERSDFTRLTKWLNGLTAIDLSAVDVFQVRTIDEWMKFMDENSPLRIQHSTGSSGKLSFIPRSSIDRPVFTEAALFFYKPFRNERFESPAGKAFVIPGFRTGFNSAPRLLQIFVDAFNIPEEDVLTLHDHMDPDIMSLAGRLLQAEKKGITDELLQNDTVLALRERLIEQKRNAEQDMKNFFAEAVGRFKGRKVWLLGTIPQLYHAAKAGLESGLKHVFHPQSFAQVGGGMKGAVLPADHLDIICEFFGLRQIHEGYGMTELMTFMPKCAEGNYHVPPQTIPYLLDPDTGNVLPRKGTQTGRFGFMDLLAITYWGGFLTGDELTISWSHDCACGRKSGPMIHPHIRRLSESRGGDDKISCAGRADDAHDRAVEFILSGNS